ncbi:hypothetical protein psal_cds_1403 [Pandoravirus salinus]|uniref:Uncharacterized protein n=1 Tax=Pandoravirus salinus TaxID=1349410 RepID=S4VYQ3_9VIRU|nr:hypothetical protein psal_cds_1403 [Pandoravirus salinus]AGO85834.1 hypothetical protein psal_cds_1403 [Pandoravirus salinus]
MTATMMGAPERRRVAGAQTEWAGGARYQTDRTGRDDAPAIIVVAADGRRQRCRLATRQKRRRADGQADGRKDARRAKATPIVTTRGSGRGGRQTDFLGEKGAGGSARSGL